MLTDWRVAAAAAIFCTGLLITCIETSAQSMPKDVAARTEIYAIPSLTISDQQFLIGDANGKQVTVAGEFRIAQGSGKLPVVVLMHGSSGVGAGMDPWVRHFNAMGISTFVIDGFSGRGLTAVGPNQALLGRLNFIVDIYRSLEILAKHPRVRSEEHTSELQSHSDLVCRLLLEKKKMLNSLCFQKNAPHKKLTI